MITDNQAAVAVQVFGLKSNDISDEVYQAANKALQDYLEAN